MRHMSALRTARSCLVASSESEQLMAVTAASACRDSMPASSSCLIGKRIQSSSVQMKPMRPGAVCLLGCVDSVTESPVPIDAISFKIVQSRCK